MFSRFMRKGVEDEAYMSRPEVRSLWRLDVAATATGRCTFACVEKRTGTELRKILQCCPFNDAIRTVEDCVGRDPGCGLQGPGALARLTSPSDTICAAVLDQSNAFSYVEVPTWWQELQAGPSIAINRLPPDWIESSGLSHLPPSTKVAPRYTRLAMGHTHSVFLLMTLNFMH